MSDDDRISAYLDDELDPEARDAFEADLGTSPELADQLAGIAEVRSQLRALGSVEPPPGFVDRVVARQHGRQRRVGLMASVGAVAATLALLFGFTPATDSFDVVPAIDRLVAEHASASPDMDEATMMDGDDMPAMPPADMDAHDITVRHAVHLDDGVDWVQYEGSDGSMLSVFRQPGALDEAGLPTAGEMTDVGDDIAWVGEMDRRGVLVMDHGGWVYTLVADDGDDMMTDMASGMPDEADGLGARLRDAAAAVVETFGFG